MFEDVTVQRINGDDECAVPASSRSSATARPTANRPRPRGCHRSIASPISCVDSRSTGTSVAGARRSGEPTRLRAGILNGLTMHIQRSPARFPHNQITSGTLSSAILGPIAVTSPGQIKGSGLFYLASVVVRLRTWHAQNEIVRQVKCSTF